MALAQLLAERRIVAIVRIPSYGDIVPLTMALVEGGITVIELTLTAPGVPAAVRELRSHFADSAVIGVGTVLHLRQVDECVKAGAQFAVSPAVRPDLASVCQDANLPYIPGAFTPSEVASAMDAGCSLLKLFPARLGGPDHLRDLAGPFPNARFIPTGGITVENARDYLAAGAIAVGMGSSLVPAAAVEAQRWDVIRSLARSALAATDG